MMEWVKCSDKLPEDSQKIIFYVKDRDNVYAGQYVCLKNSPKGKQYRFMENLDGWWFDGEEITHWLPITNPPEAE